MAQIRALLWCCTVLLCMGEMLSNSAFADESPIYSSMATAQPVWAEQGMVSSQEALASQVGVEILKQGGNAVDAAVAVGFSLAVTLPRAGNIGGGGFMLVHLAKENKTIAIDYREMAPSSAHKDIFVDKEGNVDPKLSLAHGLAVGVPGTVMGMELALKKYGTMTLRQVMQPAIQQAKKGIKVTSSLANSLAHPFIKKRLLEVPASKAIFYKQDGSIYQPNETWIQSDLAHSLELIAKHGSAGFYQGETANKIVAAVKAAGGIMTLEDLKNYRVLERKPVTGTYRGYEVISMPPPSSGGVHIIEMLNMLELYPVVSWVITAQPPFIYWLK